MKHLFRTRTPEGSVMILPTNFGVEVVAKGLGRVHSIVSASYLKGNAPSETFVEDRSKALEWARGEGLRVALPGEVL